MTTTNTTPAEILDVSHQSELAALCRMLSVGQGAFSLSIAVCNSPALRSRLIDAARAQFPAFEVVTIPPQTVDVYGVVRDHVTCRDTALFLIGLEASISDSQSDDTTLRSLNASRDLWPTAFACPIVFWLPEYAARALSETARDFWRVRSHRFYFVVQDYSPTLRQPDTYEGRYLTATSLSEDEKRTRIAELQQRLAQADPSSPNMQSHLLRWWDELAVLHNFVGNSDEALRIRREEELPTYERLGDVYGHAVTMGKIADVLSDRGELEEALRIRFEEELPAFQSLGDIHDKAITAGKIADIFELKGNLDEALRVRREVQLPVYEQIGDLRGKAVTMSKIADVLHARGDLDEALRIRMDEQLAICEQTGDIRGKAVAWGQIADIFQDRGELDAAIKIRRDKELPVYTQLGDVRSRAVAMSKLADILHSRGELDEALRIRQEEELPIFERLRDVRSKAMTQGKIASVFHARGDFDEALRLFRGEVLPVFEQLHDLRSQAICQTQIANVFLQRNQGADRRRAKELLTEALATAERLKIPEAKQIRQRMRQEGFLR